MESATTIPPNGAGTSFARLRAVPANRWAQFGFGFLCLLLLLGYFVYPTYPNYDSYYDMLWGRELLHGGPVHFDGFRIPTEHPLAIALGALMVLLGDDGDRVWNFLIIASFAVLVWGVYRLGRIAFTPLIGGIAAILLVTRIDFPFLAARGYIDVPYMALVVWAGVLEAERRRRGTAPMILLALAGLLRPEAWLLIGLYWLWCFKELDWPGRIKLAVLAASAPVIWCGLDLAVTHDALFSLHHTSSSAEDLGRTRTLSQIPGALPTFFSHIVKFPVFVAAVFGLVAAVFLFPRRLGMPMILLVASIGTFFAIAVAGLSVIDRYLTIGALAALVFAGVAVGGWTMLGKGRVRTAWMVVALGLIGYGVVYSIVGLNLNRFENELSFRGDAHDALEAVLHNPAVTRGLKCGPLTTPNHKLVPDSRWILNASYGQVRARAERIPTDSENRPFLVPKKGVYLEVTSRIALFKHAYTDSSDPPEIEVIPPNFKLAAVSDYYAAYVAC